MAHSDVFIFLNSITWIFFLFLGLYFFLVTFFLPSLYKKVRLRTLVKQAYIWKFSAKLLNFFAVKLLILGARLPVSNFEFLVKEIFSYFNSFIMKTNYLVSFEVFSYNTLKTSLDHFKVFF